MVAINRSHCRCSEEVHDTRRVETLSETGAEMFLKSNTCDTSYITHQGSQTHCIAISMDKLCIIVLTSAGRGSKLKCD